MPSILRNRPNALARLVLESETTYATTLFALMVDRLVDEETSLQEVCDWHPQTRRLELQTEIGGQMPPVNSDKLSVAVDIVTSDSFFQRVPVFINYCNILSGDPLAFGTFDWADAEECGWGIIEGLLLSPPEQDEEPFSAEIRRHLGYVLEQEGIKSPPDVLRIATGGHKADFAGMPADDPLMFSGTFKMQSDEAAEIEKSFKARLQELVAELEQVPWKSEVAKDFKEKLKQGLR